VFSGGRATRPPFCPLMVGVCIMEFVIYSWVLLQTTTVGAALRRTGIAGFFRENPGLFKISNFFFFWENFHDWNQVLEHDTKFTLLDCQLTGMDSLKT